MKTTITADKQRIKNCNKPKAQKKRAWRKQMNTLKAQ
jgi:hypothetical protein